MRTTLNIDDPILREVKELQRREGKSLGRVVSDLLAYALANRSRDAVKKDPFSWHSKPMGARVDLSDSDALYSTLDESENPVEAVAEE